LLLVGEPDSGKTSLVYHRANSTYPYNGLAHFYPTYYLAIGQKYFPPYKSYDYSLVNWQQFTIVSDMFPKSGYARLLNYLDGSVSALPQKGRPAVQRQDNPKHILTSNRTLVQHIQKTFNSPQALALSLNNLPARIECVVVPDGKNIHFLRKLFVAENK
jgi:GTPase SAR1 family protein